MNSADSQSSEFLVEVNVEGEPAYIVCTRAGGPFFPDSVPGLPRAELDSLLQGRALRAVAMSRPGAETAAPSTFAAFKAQSMTNEASMARSGENQGKIKN